ncbi:ATP-dependent DNA helicase PIF1 [Elysia marginata]|uniref:ATP-dependent DNA helicase PIF1 n=1 Tax=Elysia marginata TaxID=1093978 RepID=A0AAV4I819_9GAST|nr:ATP-dependent DNA helicase PIF1 [Elysia marginata]
MVYLSIDTTVTDEESVHYPTEFLNSIEVAGLPSHKLCIKVGMPVMVMRSLTPPRVMNGTRCIFIKTTQNAVIVKIASGPYCTVVKFTAFQEYHYNPLILLYLSLLSDDNFLFNHAWPRQSIRPKARQ